MLKKRSKHQKKKKKGSDFSSSFGEYEDEYDDELLQFRDEDNDFFDPGQHKISSRADEDDIIKSGETTQNENSENQNVLKKKQ